MSREEETHEAMSHSCRRIDPLVTPYVDGVLEAADRETVDRHVRLCPPCRSRLAAEREVRAALVAHRPALTAERAPAPLAARCAGVASPADAAPAARRRVRPAALAVAATLVLAVAGLALYQATASSARVMAAELTADHMKCFIIDDVLGTHHDAAQVSRAMASQFDWDVRLPPHPEEADLELVGSRPCLYAEGRIAHIMYRYHGRPVSIFMLPDTIRARQTVDVMGHEAAIWSSGGRTFVLIANESQPDLARIESFVHGALE
jgi:anti-sigma factor RsiW